MKFLPARDSQKWFLVMLFTWFINLGALVISRYQVGATFDLNITMAFASLSLLVAFVITLGYFGIDAFTKTIVFFNLIAIFNLLYITTTKVNEGWSDITSLINYIFFLIIGVLAGIMIQASKSYFDTVEGKKKTVKKAVKQEPKKVEVKKVVKPTAKKKTAAKKK